MSASFKGDTQRAHVCMTLLHRIGLGHYWTEHGPTEAAIDIWEKRKFGPWSHGEQVIWAIVWALWTGNDAPAVPFGEIIYTLDGTNLQIVGTLIASLASSSGVDRWLNQWWISQ